MLQSTILALLAFLAGLALHLRWHPLRREFSDAWDFLRLRQPLVVLIAGLMLLSGATSGFSMDALLEWRALWPPLLLRAVTETALLFHAAIPPWPLALLLPLVLIILTVRVWRWPYRYGERMPVPEQKLALIGLSLAGAVWVLIEAAGLRRMLPEWLESMKLGTRLVFTAIAAAGTQVWLSRLVMAWVRPPDTDADRDAVAALEAVFARWQRVLVLGAFDLLWMAWRSWRPLDNGTSGWLLPEFLLLFSAMPLAVAVGGSNTPPWQTGATALRIFLSALPALAVFLPTATAFLMLGAYATDMAVAMCAPGGAVAMIARSVGALALAMLHGWLCLASLLLMLRHGFPRPPSADPQAR